MDWSNWINGDGFVTAQAFDPTSPGEGNGWLQTGLAIATGMYTLPNVEELIARCRKSPTCPLIFRSPYKRNPDDHEEIDDYWGVLPLSQPWANEILTWGNSHHWEFDVQEGHSFVYWWWRYPPFPAFLKFCAGVPVGRFGRAVLAAAIFYDAMFISHADGNMKAFCRASYAAKKSKACAWAFSFWKKRVKKKYGTIGKSWAAYFGAGHPLSTYDGEA